MFRALDTRNGTGEQGGAAQLGAGHSLAVAVTGIDGVPADATSVVVNVVALNATASGYLTTYNSDIADPNVASVGVKSGISTNQTDTIPVSSTGTVSVANHTSASLDVVITLMGYYTGSSDSAAGDTYGDAPWSKIVDTVSGLGAPQAQIPAGGSVTVQVSGQGGIATGADTAVLQLSAPNASQGGYLTAYAARTSDPGVSALFYDSSMIYRDLVYVPLSSAGKITVTNHGSAAVDLMIYTRGYFMPPITTPVGAEYAPIGTSVPVMVYGSQSGGAQVGANASVTFQVAGVAGLPMQGVVEVAEHVVVTNPASSGYLDVYRGGGTDPNHATMNFLAGDGTDVGYQDSILSQVSPTGQETITNHSSGSLQLQVSVIGYYAIPQPPPTPSYLQSTGTDTTAPILSGVVQDSSGDGPLGEVFLFDSAGNPIGGSPTATGQVIPGESLTWQVPSGNLTNGNTYQWYMETCDLGVCSAPTATQTFTVNTSAAPPPPTANASATISGTSVTGYDAITDSGACSGADCTVAANPTLNAGGDGSHHWASFLGFNLSAIPANAIITSATLNLAQQSCLGSCGSGPWTGTLDIYPADSAVTSGTTGPQLVAAAGPDAIVSAPGAAGSYDLTSLAQSWVTGGVPSSGLILEAASNATATTGASYYSPTASAPSADLPQLAVNYVKPVPPTAPSNLHVTPGDGGVEVQWNAPTSQGDAQGVTGYTIQALTGGGTVAASASPGGTSVVLTGLTNAQTYSISVTAANAEGNSPAATAAGVTPAAVSGSSADATAVQQFLNAQTAVQEGTYYTAPKAAIALTSNGTQAAMISPQLDNEQSFDLGFVSQAQAYDSEDTAGTNTLSGTLVVPVSGGGAQVYTTDNLTYTTITGVGTGTQESTPSGGNTDYLFTVSAGTSPVITAYVDADAATWQITQSDGLTAVSPALNALPAGWTPPDPTSRTTGSESVPSTNVNLKGVASWANKHAGDPKSTNPFQNDCTDFVSRALHTGGGDPEYPAPGPDPDVFNDQYWWYQYNFGTGTAIYSHSWSVSEDLAYHYSYYGKGHRLKYWSNAHPGDIIFANWNNSASPARGFDGITHAGVIVAMSNGVAKIAQHSTNRVDPWYRWKHYAPNLSIWIFVPFKH